MSRQNFNTLIFRTEKSKVGVGGFHAIVTRVRDINMYFKNA